MIPSNVAETQTLLAQHRYLADESLATAVFLALQLKRPLFLEGEAGVGKTELAKVLATMLGRKMLRLQCYEGLDVASAVYEWNYARQMIEIRLAESSGASQRPSMLAEDIFSERFLIKRPLLQAMESDHNDSPVLLIDELDRADEPFEAFLLEALSDYQVTIPEIGAFKASVPPLVVITSNRTREIHDALKRRCLYCWIGYPDVERELTILRTRASEVGAALSREVVSFVHEIRTMDMFKQPGIAESIDWANALHVLDVQTLGPEQVRQTLGVLLKYQDDIEKVQTQGIEYLIDRSRQSMVTVDGQRT